MRARLAMSLVWGLVMLCALPSMGWAQAQDFDFDSSDWNGMQDFKMVAQAQKVTLVVHDTLDYAAMDPDEPWILIHPKGDLKAGSLSRYIVKGGRVLLADDFGRSDAFLERLDLSRVMPTRGALPHNRFVKGNPALPVFTPKGVHPLLEGVKKMVANHPAILFNIGGPVVSYDEGGGLVYDMNLGQGKVVVLSDSSVLINHMILLADNDTFVRNALAYLCKGAAASCTVHVAAGDFAQRGSFGRDEQKNLLGMSKDLLESVDSFNSTIAQAMRGLPTAKLFYFLGIFLVAGLGVYLYTIFPIRQTRLYSAYLSDTQQEIAAPQSEYDWNISRFMTAGPQSNYLLPVSILKELFESLFLEGIDHAQAVEGGQRPDIVALSERYKQMYLQDYPQPEAERLREQALATLATLARVPTRHRVFLEGDLHFTERELLDLHDRVLNILEHMGKKDDYERRTRSNI